VTAPSQQQPRPVAAAPLSLSRILLTVGTVLFVLASFAAGGDTLGGISAWAWGFGAFAAWMLSGAVP
jgi:hypothetical protein